MQTAWLIPLRSVIFQPIACLFFLRMPNRLSSCEALSKEDMTTEHCSCSSKLTYFNSTSKGLRSRFCGSLIPSLVSKGKISFFFFSNAPTQYSCLRLPTALQDNQLVPQLTHSAFAADSLFFQDCFNYANFFLDIFHSLHVLFT